MRKRDHMNMALRKRIWKESGRKKKSIKKQEIKNNRGT